jgi:ABC-2 type transport system permease protein
MTAITIPVLPTTRFDRLRWAVVDCLTMVRRDLTYLLRSPGEVVGGLLFPIVTVLLFGYVFGSAIAVPGGGNYREFLMPGLFGMTMAFGIGNTATAVVADTSRGVTDRFRSMPMARSAVICGRSVADLLNAVSDLALLVLCGLVVGWRWHEGIGSALLAIGLLLLLRFSLIWPGILLGLIVRTPETAMRAFTLVLPFSMIANTFVSPAMMPGWLGAVAEWNPLSATVAAARDLFGNPGVGGTGGFPTEHAVVLAIIWPLLIMAVFIPLSMRRYQRLSR